MANRVRYYITESEDRAVVRSVPVAVVQQPVHDLMSIDNPVETPNRAPSAAIKPVGRIVKVLRKPTHILPGR